MCQFLYLIAFVIYTITFLLFNSASMLNAIIFLRNSSIFKLAEGQIFSLFSLIIIFLN